MVSWLNIQAFLLQGLGGGLALGDTPRILSFYSFQQPIAVFAGYLLAFFHTGSHSRPAYAYAPGQIQMRYSKRFTSCSPGA